MLAKRHIDDEIATNLLFVNLERGSTPETEWLPFAFDNSECLTPKQEQLPLLIDETALEYCATEDSLQGALTKAFLRDLSVTIGEENRRRLYTAYNLALEKIAAY